MMILFDPDLGTDLDPDPSPNAMHSARAKSAAAHTTLILRKSRVPSGRTLARFLREAQAAVRLHGEVTVLFTTDAAIRSLNRRFRGKNKATDVLSFPAGNFGPEKIAGDLAISVPMARKQGAAFGHSLGTELKVLILHGLLHLAGYDHETDSGQMARRERVLRARLKLPLGLIERMDAHEGDGLQPVRKKKTKAAALVAAGQRGVAASSGAKAPHVSRGEMYGLKPAPSSLEIPVKIALSHPSRKNKNAARVGHPAVVLESRARRREL
jgi:probable rRNA maturation factor